jgi:hypothetical protein
MAGTSLNGVLSVMAAKSEILGVRTKNLDGTLRPLAEVFHELNKREMSLADATDIFGQRASKAAMNLAKYADTLESREENLQQFGATQRAVNEQLGTFDNVWKNYLSKQEAVNISIWDQIKDAAKGFVGDFTDMLVPLNEWILKTEIASKVTKAFLDGIGYDLPSGDSIEEFLDCIDVDAIVEYARKIGAAIGEIINNISILAETVAPAVSLVIDNMDILMEALFWTRVINMTRNFVTSIIGLLGTLTSPLGMIGSVAWMAFDTWKNVTGRSSQEIQAMKNELDSVSHLVQTENAVEELGKLQTGFEQTSEAVQHLTGKAKEFFNMKVAEK